MGLNRLCVFAGARDGAHEAYGLAAAALGTELAERGVTLVYGGASIGLMGTLADAVVAAGGRAIGVIPRSLAEREVAHAGLDELHVVDSMHTRKALMGELSDAFVALPGGLGTLEELLEAATWTQLGIHAKPIGLLNVRGYYDRLWGMLDHGVAEGFLAPEHRRITLIETDRAALLDALGRWRAPNGGRPPPSPRGGPAP